MSYISEHALPRSQIKCSLKLSMNDVLWVKKEAGTLLFYEADSRPSLVFTPFDLRYMDYKETLSLLMGKEFDHSLLMAFFSVFKKWSSFCLPSKLVSAQHRFCAPSDGEPFPAKALSPKETHGQGFTPSPPLVNIWVLDKELSHYH